MLLKTFEIIGMIASFSLPLFNIPLMLRMIQRKSSDDLSLVWVGGVFASLVSMLPAGLISSDFTFKVFSILNVVFFSGVTFLAFYFRFRKKTIE